MGKPLPKKLVALVLERDGGFCLLAFDGCVGVATVADHRANRGAGGAGRVLDCPSNLVAACWFCNGWKESGADRADLVKRGLRVNGGRTHTHTAEKAREIPVTYPDGITYLLDDYGGRRRAEHETGNE